MDCRPISDFQKLKTLGEGSYGTIYKAKDSKNDVIVALKKLKTEGASSDVSLENNDEITILRSLDHENIACLLGVALEKSLFESTFLILEFYPFSLASVIDCEESSDVFGQSEVKCIINQLFCGLRHIHSHSFIHRDICVNNIMFSTSGALKICDFGSSCLFSDSEMTPNIGSRWYLAPELLFGSSRYDSAVDMWSAGCVFAELILKRPLFKANSDATMITLIVNMLGIPNESIWPGCSELPIFQMFDITSQQSTSLESIFKAESQSCIELLQKLFVYSPQKRITADTSLLEPYFGDLPLACSLESLLEKLKMCEEIDKHF